MSTVGVTRALRFDPAAVTRLGDVLAPPYDVVSESDARALRQRHRRNLVHLTNPEGRSEDRYHAAAATLRSWIAEGILRRDERPCAYLHRHRFDVRGVRHQRTGLWLLLRLTPFGSGVVLPHEMTMGGPKADRLALMRACRAQLSPIFLICSDTDGDLAEAIRGHASAGPDERAEFPAGESHEIWRIGEKEALDAIGARLGERVFLIADGHHRYETALAYRDELVAAGAPETGRNAHEFALVYVVSERDPGLLLFPTHRVIRGLRVDWRGALANPDVGVDVRELEEAELDRALADLDERVGEASFIVIARDEPGGWLVRCHGDEPETTIASAALHERFLERSLGIEREEQVRRTSYWRDPGEAVEQVRRGEAEAAVLLAAPRVDQVRAAAAAGRRLPPKTTYFWPKVPTGIAIHTLDPNEEVRLLGSSRG